MLEVVLAVCGVAVGGAVAWAVVHARVSAAARVERAALEARVVALETREKELDRHATERQLELGDLRAALDAERMERARVEERWSAERRNIDEQRRLLEQARERLSDTFRALSAQTLTETSGAFLERAREVLDAQLGQRQQAVEALLKPLEDALRRSETQVHELERARQHAYGSLEEQLRALAEQSRQLQRETSTLASALRASQARGRWGEIALRRVVELAGMTEHCDFVEQVTVDGDAGRLRPDMIVRLPGGRAIIVDSKVPLAAYLDAADTTAHDARQDALARHARALRSHMTQLAGKAYWKQFPESPDLVVMFIPGEPFVSAAAEADPELVSDAMEQRVVIATPMILFALLAAVAHGWKQQVVAKSAEEVRRLGQELYERLATLGGHFRSVGQALAKAVESYNDAVGSVERRVFPAARRFRDLGAGTRDDIPALESVDGVPRRLAAPEFEAQVDAPADGDTVPARAAQETGRRGGRTNRERSPDDRPGATVDDTDAR